MYRLTYVIISGFLFDDPKHTIQFDDFETMDEVQDKIKELKKLWKPYKGGNKFMKQLYYYDIIEYKSLKSKKFENKLAKVNKEVSNDSSLRINKQFQRM